MRLRSLAARYTSTTFRRIYRRLERFNDDRIFKSLPVAKCDTSNLRPASTIPKAIDSDWDLAKMKIERFSIPDDRGGVSKNCQEIIYNTVKSLNPETVLEIGTHIGSSTAAIALGCNAEILTLDIRDVNKEYAQYGMKHSPDFMLNSIGANVQFVISDSITYMNNCNLKFDFIFLDGNHDASVVYTEVPIALKLLNSNGVILLHDYYPNGRPINEKGNVIHGPYKAIQRLIQEGNELNVMPLRKKNSLALLVG